MIKCTQDVMVLLGAKPYYFIVTGFPAFTSSPSSSYAQAPAAKDGAFRSIRAKEKRSLTEEDT